MRKRVPRKYIMKAFNVWMRDQEGRNSASVVRVRDRGGMHSDRCKHQHTDLMQWSNRLASKSLLSQGTLPPPNSHFHIGRITPNDTHTSGIKVPNTTIRSFPANDLGNARTSRRLSAPSSTIIRRSNPSAMPPA